jgi:FixJ family two-component response regulator
MSEVPLISIIDDDKSVRESTEMLIDSNGFEAEAFGSAEEFLDSGRLADSACLILDVRLPGMSGLSLFDELVATKSAVPVIFITAHDDDEARSHALQAGAHAFILKPSRRSELIGALESALESRRGGRHQDSS